MKERDFPVAPCPRYQGADRDENPAKLETWDKTKQGEFSYVAEAISCDADGAFRDQAAISTINELGVVHIADAIAADVARSTTALGEVI